MRIFSFPFIYFSIIYAPEYYPIMLFIIMEIIWMGVLTKKLSVVYLDRFPGKDLSKNSLPSKIKTREFDGYKLLLWTNKIMSLV